jgi:hypothetical protein
MAVKKAILTSLAIAAILSAAPLRAGAGFSGGDGCATEPCIGDCNFDQEVRPNEIVLGVRIALGRATLDECPALDPDGDSRPSVRNLVCAVINSITRCGQNPLPTLTPTPRATPTPTPTVTQPRPSATSTPTNPPDDRPRPVAPQPSVPETVQNVGPSIDLVGSFVNFGGNPGPIIEVPCDFSGRFLTEEDGSLVFENCAFTPDVTTNGTIRFSGGTTFFDLSYALPGLAFDLEGQIAVDDLGAGAISLNGNLTLGGDPSFSLEYNNVVIRDGVIASGSVVIRLSDGMTLTIFFDGFDPARILVNGDPLRECTGDVRSGVITCTGGDRACTSVEKPCGDGCIFVEDDCCSGGRFCPAGSLCPADTNRPCVRIPP